MAMSKDEQLSVSCDHSEQAGHYFDVAVQAFRERRGAHPVVAAEGRANVLHDVIVSSRSIEEEQQHAQSGAEYHFANNDATAC